MLSQHLLLPSSVADVIAASGASWGSIGMRHLPGDDLYVIASYAIKQAVKRPALSQWLDSHSSRGASTHPGVGFWYRADPELNATWAPVWHREVSITTDAFRERVKAWQQPGNAIIPVLTYADSADAPSWRAWLLSKQAATPITLDVVPENADILFGLAGAWPLDLVANDLISIIGVGSIGSCAAEALAGYGIRRLALVDPDRLRFHNLARHRLSAGDIGRFKVNAMRDYLQDRDPDLEVHPLALDITEDADELRALFKQSRLVLVCSDGIASRRAANHLACWAGKPAIFACVLENGGIGEVLRVIPGLTSCLGCFREKLAADGSLNPEPDLDRGYGTGSRHLPMTAPGGDLDLVGKLAAKTAVATLLATGGYWEQRLPHDHLVVGLQPPPSLPAPFDVSRAGEMKWNDTGRRATDCPAGQFRADPYLRGGLHHNRR
jgi:hypothetical protein